MPAYKQKKQNKIAYKDAPSGFINIGKWEPPFAPVKNGFGFVGVLAEDSKTGQLQCHECGKWFEQLPTHYTQKHKMNGKQYRKKFGLLSNTALKSKRIRLIHSKVCRTSQEAGLMNLGNREGFGAIFSKGALKAAHKIHPDSVERVAHSKGMDFPAHDPRSCFSLATTYAVGTRGACHMRGVSEDVEMGNFYIPEIGVTEKTTEMLSDDNQALMALKLQDFCALLNSLCLCTFMTDGGEMSFEEVKNLFNSATGWNCSIDELMKAGTRIVTVQRLINVRDGFDGTTDTLPKAMSEPAREGYRAGKVPNLNRQLKEYYEMRGWDHNGYVPNRVLEELGLQVTPL